MYDTIRAIAVLFALLAAGCGGDRRNQGDPDASDADADSDTDSDGDADSDAVCDTEEFSIYHEPARVMILQDDSSSMTGENWNSAKNAIATLLDNFGGGSIEFGLDAYPDPGIGSCQTTAPVLVDCAAGTETSINDEMSSISPILSTPLYDALYGFIDPDYAPGCTATALDKYIVLVADGEDSCSSPPTADFITVTQTLVDLGIKVIVVGFNVNMDAAMLTAIAENGGTDFTDFLLATNETELIDAFNTIGSTVVTCIFTIAEPDELADPDEVNFYFDGVIVPYDEDCSSGTGWRWVDDEHTQVEFCPDSCQQLKDLEVEEVYATFGCDTVIE
jgi:hypothetical protein